MRGTSLAPHWPWSRHGETEPSLRASCGRSGALSGGLVASGFTVGFKGRTSFWPFWCQKSWGVNLCGLRDSLPSAPHTHTHTHTLTVFQPRALGRIRQTFGSGRSETLMIQN